MSVNSSSTPIHTLNSDVLLCIFTINADIFSDSQSLQTQSLHNTRSASQVCHPWRSLMLDTPSLWAKLFDMDELYNMFGREWWNELLRRSGAAPLWIKASWNMFRQLNMQPTDKSKQFEHFFDVIGCNFHRIQKMDVHSSEYFLSSLTLAKLCVSAPHLEVFEVSLTEETLGAAGGAPIFPIFAGQAPLLRRFRLDGYIITLQEPWLRHLHFIELNHRYGVPQILKILSATHDLQELVIEYPESGASTRLPSVSLPRLKHLQYDGHPSTCARLMDHVVIPLGCSLAISISHSNDRAKKAKIREQILRVVDIFVRHAKRYLEAHTIDTLFLDYIQRESISLQGETIFPAACALDISIPLTADRSSNLLEPFLSKLATLNFANITRLDISTDGSFDACFGPFFCCLPSVDTICVHSQTLKYLMMLQEYMLGTKKRSIIFPSLKVIDLVIIDSFKIIHYQMSYVKQVRISMNFILSRIRNGHPVTTLDMSKHLALEATPNLDALAKVQDLRVLYKLLSSEAIFEVICGSGDVEKHTVML